MQSHRQWCHGLRFRIDCLRSALVVGLALACGIVSPGARAQDSTQNQFWPEIETYVTLDPKTRLEFDVQRSTDSLRDNTIQFGPTLQFFVKPFFSDPLMLNDKSHNNLLVFAVGYRYIAGIDQPQENRIELDATPQWHTPWRGVLSDRNRIELRAIEGSGFSWRYRNQLTFQRTFHVHRAVVSPYARGEVYYNSVPSSWNKSTYSFGADIPIKKRFQLEPYFERDIDVGSTPDRVNAVGLILYIYFRNNGS